MKTDEELYVIANPNHTPHKMDAAACAARRRLYDAGRADAEAWRVAKATNELAELQKENALLWSEKATLQAQVDDLQARINKRSLAEAEHGIALKNLEAANAALAEARRGRDAADDEIAALKKANAELYSELGTRTGTHGVAPGLTAADVKVLRANVNSPFLLGIIARGFGIKLDT